MLRERYLDLTELGGGGMGKVYKAKDTQLGGRLVAIKEMRQDRLNAEEIAAAAKAFKQEANMLAALQHPYLPSIYEYFEEAGRWYFVMEFIEGETLEAYLRKQGGKLAIQEVLDIGVQLCTVLDYLHTHHPPIIFRDLKPLNIMRASNGHLYLIDFGIARHFTPGKLKDTAIAYSQGFAAPEQYGEAQTTTRSDIYSLGATLHQLLTGIHPAKTPFRFTDIETHGQMSLTRLNALLLQMVNIDESKRPANVASIKQMLRSLATPNTTNPGISQTFVPPFTQSLPNLTQTMTAPPLSSNVYEQPMINTANPYNSGNRSYVNYTPYPVRPSYTSRTSQSFLQPKKEKILYPRILFLVSLILLIPSYIAVFYLSSHDSSYQSTGQINPIGYIFIGMLMLGGALMFASWIWVIVYAARRRQVGWIVGLIFCPGGLALPLYLLLNPGKEA